MIAGKLDEIDFKILNILQQDASIDVAKLAAMVHRTPNPIHERIRKLQECGLIKKFTAILDREQVGLPVLVVLMVKLKEQNTERMIEFEKMVTVMPQVQSCLTVSGTWNYILQVTAATPQDYAVWLLEKVNINSNVGHVESAFLMKECKNYGALVLQTM